MNESSDLFILDGESLDLLSNVTSLPSPGASWYLARQLLLYSLQVAVISLGIVSNAVNILVFLKVGLHDSVTISFFSLSVSDLLHLVCFFILRMLTILQYEFGLSSAAVRLQDLAGWLGWLAVYFMDVSMYITVFATVQKCCCVAFPLTFKHTFTDKRSALVIASIWTATLVIFLPVFVLIIFKWFFDPSTKDRPLDWSALNTSPEATVWRWMHRIVFTFASQIVVIVSLAVITAKLKQSVKFRSKNKTDNKNAENDKNEAAKIGWKELRVIQAVQLIAVIFIVATMPASINSLVTVIYPHINHPRYHDIVFTLVAIIYFGGTLNASVNIIVYLKYNSKYRSAFINTVCGFRNTAQPAITTRANSSTLRDGGMSAMED